MQLHELKPKTTRKKATRIGRGSTRGKTSGRGHKGQNAHGGHGKRPEERDIIKKLPKLRGHGVNRGRTVNPTKERPQTVTLAQLEKLFSAGDTVTPGALLTHGIVSRFRGRAPQVKIVATGTLTHALTVASCKLTEASQEAVEKAGGKVE